MQQVSKYDCSQSSKRIKIRNVNVQKEIISNKNHNIIRNGIIRLIFREKSHVMKLSFKSILEATFSTKNEF